MTVLADGKVVGCIFLSTSRAGKFMFVDTGLRVPRGSRHGYEATRTLSCLIIRYGLTLARRPVVTAAHKP
jgi:hypothetical protein